MVTLHLIKYELHLLYDFADYLMVNKHSKKFATLPVRDNGGFHLFPWVYYPMREDSDVPPIWVGFRHISP